MKWPTTVGSERRRVVPVPGTGHGQQQHGRCSDTPKHGATDTWLGWELLFFTERLNRVDDGIHVIFTIRSLASDRICARCSDFFIFKNFASIFGPRFWVR